MVHESRASTTPADAPAPPQTQTSPDDNPPQVQTVETGPQHIVLGDSLVKGLRVPGAVNICKGGIRPDEILQLLAGSVDTLHPSEYDGVKTLTLIVGTNSLNVPRPGAGKPLLDVIEDYKKLVEDLRKLSPVPNWVYLMSYPEFTLVKRHDIGSNCLIVYSIII